MHRRHLALISGIIGGVFIGTLLLAYPGNEALPAGGPKRAAGNGTKDLFGLTKVWTVHLEIAAAEFEAMEPVLGGFGFPGGPAPKKKAKNRDSEKNLFGTDFPWVIGDFTADGKTLKKVGVRYAGDITYFVSRRGLKRPLMIAFDKFAGQRFHGLPAIQLHAMPLDPSKAREALAYSLFRAAGVPAPRRRSRRSRSPSPASTTRSISACSP